MLEEYQRIYREGLEMKKATCADILESLNTRAMLNISEILVNPTINIQYQISPGINTCKQFTNVHEALKWSCANGRNYIEIILPKFNDTVRNTKNDTLNIVTGKYFIHGHNCDGFEGPTIIEELKKKIAPGLVVSLNRNVIRIEVPI
jgi:hypothetical protein